ncbi:DNA repair protein complementing XP-C cells homolog [Cephus cinctus]|uniref:DNA repair protein complementing XP-C cells homolog n=1 Tax=Cephus cinctus TaxID=211228 RepID=A0AAJ7C193_CEPCN|nr:DNA repair protein complementing XP-C cells homolog [Cephus cinctus]
MNSDDESSSSSNEFLVSADKINFNSSFFDKPKPNLKTESVVTSVDSEDEFEDVNNTNSAEVITQTLKNLENWEKHEIAARQQEGNDTKKEDENKKAISRSSLLSKEIEDLLLLGETPVTLSNYKVEHDDTGSNTDADMEESEAQQASDYIIPEGGVTITLPGNNIMFNRKKRNRRDLETLLKNRMNQQLRTNQLLIHKVGLLCWLSHGFHLNQLINAPDILSAAAAKVSSSSYPKGRLDLAYLEKFTGWFCKSFILMNNNDALITNESLLSAIKNKKVADYKELGLLFVATLRGIGINCRLVLNLCAPPLKVNRDQLFQTKQEPSSSKDKVKEEPSSNMISEKNIKESKTKKMTKIKGLKNSKTVSRKETRELRSRNAKDRKYKLTTNQMSSESESESDAPKDTQKKISTTAKASTSKDSKYSKSKKLLSSDEESGNPTKMKKGQDVWAEVYVESEESWICVSVLEKKIHCVTEIYKKATNPVLYVVAWNSSGTLKDVTRRYCPQWLTVTRKQRVDEKWWSESLSYWKEKESALSKAEDEMLLQRELEQPLPKTVGECKGHPLYALQRHLLKYEALYPPDAVPLGHLKTGEAIYSRHCVHTLCSRETWVKNARVVKPGEESYKIVKAMPKYDKFSGMMIKDQPLELFGKWQTTQYVPPVAKDGIVPRNEYGNVDLFKMCMLPKGTVHINLPALNRVARKLNIDCAPAVVGFNFGGMGAVPAFEGFVVCEEFEDTLREAWETEQIEAAKRAQEKRDKRIYGNWKKLIRGLLIREKLAAKYGFGNKEENQEDERPSTSTKRPKQKKGGAKKTKI